MSFLLNSNSLEGTKYMKRDVVMAAAKVLHSIFKVKILVAYKGKK